MKFAPPLLLVLAACAASPAPAAPDAESKVVVDLMHRAYADLSARKFDAIGTYFLPSATFTMVGPTKVESITPAEFVAIVKKAVEGQPIYEERILSADARVHGRVAQVWIRYAARLGNASKLREWGGVDAWTLVKGRDGWKISSLSVVQD